MDKKCNHQFVSFTKDDKTNMLCRWCGLPKPTLYTIKLLEWKKNEHGTLYVETPMGRYYLGNRSWSFFGLNPCDCFSRRHTASIEDGKAQAEAHYREQLGKCLEVYDG